MVRRWGVLLVLVCFGCMCSCSAAAAQPVVSGFRCRTDIVYGDAAFVGMLDRTQVDCATLVLSEPAALSGVSMRWEGGRISVGYAGMSMELSDDDMPVGAVIGVLCDTLDNCVNGRAGDAVLEGVSDCGRYTLTVDPQTGLPLNLQVPSIALSVTFSSWELPES